MDVSLQSISPTSRIANPRAHASCLVGILRWQKKCAVQKHTVLTQKINQQTNHWWLGALRTGAAAAGRWQWLLLVLLLGSLVEAGSAGASLAQSQERPTTVQQVAEEATTPTFTESATEEPVTGDSATGSMDEPASASPRGPMTEPSTIAPQRESLDRDAIVVPSPQAAPDLQSDAVARIYILDNQVSFIPPPGFTAMSRREIEANFSKERPPVQVYANADRDVSVGITVSEISLDPVQLPKVRSILENSLESAFPGFQWLENDFVNLDGQDWIKLEFLSQAGGQRIHNDMYITLFQGKLLGFNFNSNLATDPALRALLLDSRNSISLSSTANQNED